MEAEAKLHDEERFLRAYPAAVEAGRWEEVARLLSSKCRALEKKATAANARVDALVAALEEARGYIVSEWHDKHRAVKQIDAALALARKGGE